MARKTDASDDSNGGQLVELLRSAGEKDLAAINERIAAVEQELEETTKRLRGELDGLRLLKKSIDWRLHGKPKRKSPGPHKAKSNGKQASELAERMHDLLTKEGSLPSVFRCAA
jgi:hypothetical protein